jgi:hypothetical protein
VNDKKVVIVLRIQARLKDDEHIFKDVKFGQSD